MSMPVLVWTSSQREPLCNRTPNLKPSTEPDLQEAGLQECVARYEFRTDLIWQVLICSSNHAISGHKRVVLANSSAVT
jgi:hypothetical protein